MRFRMKKSIQLLFAIYLATVVQGDTCCVPQQWEGFTFREGGRWPTEGEFRTISYDAENERLAFGGKADVDGTQTRFKVILDFNNKKRYYLYPDNSLCTTTTLNRDFTEKCIPDGVTLEKTSYLGEGNDTTDVKAYVWSITDTVNDLEIFAVVTKEDCYPIFEVSVGTINNNTHYATENYVGITAGINDSTIFTPPSYCDETMLDLVHGKLYKDHNIVKF